MLKVCSSFLPLFWFWFEEGDIVAIEVVIRKSRMRRKLENICVRITLRDLLLGVLGRVFSLPFIPFAVGVSWWCGARKDSEMTLRSMTMTRWLLRHSSNYRSQTRFGPKQ